MSKKVSKSSFEEIKDFSVQRKFTDAIEHDLIHHQKKSYEYFTTKGIDRVMREVFPVTFDDKKVTLSLPEGMPSFQLEDPDEPIEVCRKLGKTYATSLSIPVQLYREETGEFKVQELRIGNIPKMTPSATFIINGIEKTCVFQLLRSPGIFFKKENSGQKNENNVAKFVPSRGNWMEFNLDAKDRFWIRLGKFRKFHLSTFLKALGFEYRTVKGKPYPGELVFVSESKGKNLDEEKIDKRKKLASYRKQLIKVCEGWKARSSIKNADGETIVKKGQILTKDHVEAIQYLPENDGKEAYVESKVESYPDVKIGKDDDSPWAFQKCFEDGLSSGLLSRDECIKEIYLNFRPNDQIPSSEAALDFIWKRFFEGEYYDLSEVGRYQINQTFQNDDIPLSHQRLTIQDVARGINFLIGKVREEEDSDDIDHLGIRRVRGVGEMISGELKKGLMGMVKMAREKSRTQDGETQTPQTLIVPKLVLRPIDRFFSTGELVQFLDQTNPFSELVHKRKLSAMGPGGLSRKRTGFEVRDVHKTHYGRICPIETPEGANVGLITSLSLWARIDEKGFIETPYIPVDKGTVNFPKKESDVRFFNALEEEDFYVASSCVFIDEKNEISGPSHKDRSKTSKFRVSARHRREPQWVDSKEVTHLDFSNDQLVGVSASLIPFLEHDDATRALMGANMLRQSCPLISPSPAKVFTGMESAAAMSSGYILRAKGPGKIKSVSPQDADSGSQITIEYDKAQILDETGKESKKHVLSLRRYARSNQSTVIDQKPVVRAGQRVKKHEILTDGPGIKNGELALGQNLTVALMSLDGYNFEDSIVVSERIAKLGLLDSVQIEKFECVARRTRLGEEIITADIPNEDDSLLANLTKDGIVRVGTEVGQGQLLVGKLTPKPEKERTPEEKLIWKIMNQKGSDMRNTSLRMPTGEHGVVIRVDTLSKEDSGVELRPGVLQKVDVYVAIKRRLTVGDKLAGRHGNKGVVSTILPEEDMPYLSDGTPVDVILNPLGVPSRMNIGQLMELHLGWASKHSGKRAKVPVFNGCSMETIQDELEKNGLRRDGKSIVYDGRTGARLENDVVVGVMSIMKLNHLAEAKVHARSIGPYSLITQQPLGGKARGGGQRFGEMEVWALEAYGASRALQEMLTIKSDDIEGRNLAYKKMTRGEAIDLSLKPESINNLDKEIRGLGLDLEFFQHGDQNEFSEEFSQDADEAKDSDGDGKDGDNGDNVDSAEETKEGEEGNQEKVVSEENEQDE